MLHFYPENADPITERQLLTPPISQERNGEADLHSYRLWPDLESFAIMFIPDKYA